MTARRRSKRRQRRRTQTAIRRYNLWQEDPHCYWCGQTTVLPHPGLPQDLPTMATVDHLYSRFHPARHQLPRRDDYTVLACQACNRARCRRENLLFRDFLRHLPPGPALPLNCVAKCAAFRTALTLVELPDARSFPTGLCGRDLAERFLDTLQPGHPG
jgi:hypothetical protein